MIAVFAGLAAAISWAGSTVCSSRSSRLVPSTTVLSGVMVVGLTVTLPALVWSGVPAGLDASTGAWLGVSGVANVVGLGFVYAGLRVGKIAIVGALASTEGAVAAVLAVIAGERLGVGTATALLAMAGGVALAAMGDGPDVGAAPIAGARRAVLCGAAAALLFGVSLFAAGHVATSIPAVWVALPARLAGTLLVALPLAARGRLHFSRSALPFVIGAGIGEVTGGVAFALGARHSIAVTAVLGSEFAALAAVAAYVFFRERLNPRQLVGVATIAVAVAAVSALQA